MKRVCSVAYTHYASDPRVRRMAEALAARGDEIECLCLRAPGDPAEEMIDGVRVVHLNQSRYRGNDKLRYFWAYFVFLMRAFLAITTRHSRARFDVVHVNNMPNFIVFAALLPRIQGARVILDIHDTMPEQFGERFGSGSVLGKFLVWEERLSAAFAHRVFCVHEFQRQTLARRGVPELKLRVVMNVPDERIWAREAPVNEPSEEIREEPVLLAFHGTLSPDRRVDVAFEAMAKLRAKMPNLALRVLGNGDELPRLRRIVEDLDIADRVDMSGEFVPVDQVPARLAGADLGIIPSHAEWGLPTKLMEYAMMGIPVIAPRTKVIAHYFSDDMVKFVTPGSADDLATAIWDLAGDPAACRRFAENARRFAEAHAWSREKEIYFESVDGSADDSELAAA